MGRRLLLTALAALCLAAPAGAQTRALWPGVTFETGAQFTPNGPVAINVLTGPRPASGATTLDPCPLQRLPHRDRETLTDMQRRIAPSGTTAGVNGDFFSFATGVPSGVFMRDGQVASAPYGKPLERRRDDGRDARRAEDLVLRNLAGRGRQALAHHPERRAARERGRPLHAVMGPGDTRHPRLRRDDPVPLPRCRPERRPAGSGGGDARRRGRRGDSLRGRGHRRARHRCRRAHRGGARRRHDDGAADLPARLARRRRRDRRRPADRPQRRSRVPGRRGVHLEPAVAAHGPYRRRPARGRPHRARRRGRPPARPLRRHDQLRARTDARAARCRHRHGARRRRLHLDGVRRQPPQPAVRRQRARDLDSAHVRLHGRLRAARRLGRLAGRRRRRRPAEPAIQARAPVHDDRHADGARRQRRVHGDRRASAGELQPRFSAASLAASPTDTDTDTGARHRHRRLHPSRRRLPPRRRRRRPCPGPPARSPRTAAGSSRSQPSTTPGSRPR